MLEFKSEFFRYMVESKGVQMASKFPVQKFLYQYFNYFCLNFVAQWLGYSFWGNWFDSISSRIFDFLRLPINNLTA